jgi:hypothetical protein
MDAYQPDQKDQHSGNAGHQPHGPAIPGAPNVRPWQQNFWQEKYYFDKVLAGNFGLAKKKDVPCSGDGAMRKLPQRWKFWRSGDGLNLHELQVTFLKKAIQMTKVGGKIVYSTCSLNPIEVLYISH